MNVKKILAGAVASVMALSTMAVASNAADLATASLTFADGVASFYWSADEAEGVENNTVAITGDGEYTISAKVSSTVADEATGEDIVGPCTGLEVLALDIDFGADVDLATAYPNARVEVTSLKLGDTAITLDFAGMENVTPIDENTKNNYEKPYILRQNLYNTWGGNIFAFEKPENLSYESITVTFTVSGLGGDEGTGNEGNTDNEGETTTAPDNGNTDTTQPDKETPDTGVEGVAVVAGLAIVAAGAVVVAKKRK